MSRKGIEEMLVNPTGLHYTFIHSAGSTVATYDTLPMSELWRSFSTTRTATEISYTSAVRPKVGKLRLFCSAALWRQTGTHRCSTSNGIRSWRKARAAHLSQARTWRCAHLSWLGKCNRTRPGAGFIRYLGRVSGLLAMAFGGHV